MTREQEETQGGPGGLGGPQGARRPKPRGKGGNLGELRQQQRRFGEGKERRGSRGRAVRGPPDLCASRAPGSPWERLGVDGFSSPLPSAVFLRDPCGPRMAQPTVPFALLCAGRGSWHRRMDKDTGGLRAGLRKERGGRGG